MAWWCACDDRERQLPWLAADADLLIENYAPGVLDRLGLSAEAIAKINPDLVYISMGAFGSVGPWSEFRAYGSTTEQASGFPFINGAADWAPCLQHIAYGDPIAGIYAAAASLVALYGRQVTGGTTIDLARKFEDYGVEGVIYTDIGRDGMLTGINIEATVRLAREIKVPVIASGGLASIADVEKLAQHEADGIIGAIAGRAIYEGTLNFKDALKAALDLMGYEGGLPRAPLDDLWPEFVPEARDKVVTHRSYSGFFETSLHDTLRALDVNTLVVTGCITEIHLFATATDALQRGYVVTIPPDVQAGASEVAEQVTLLSLALSPGYPLISTRRSRR